MSKGDAGDCGKEREAYCPCRGCETIGLWGGAFDTPGHGTIGDSWIQSDEYIQVYRENQAGCHTGYSEGFCLQVWIVLKNIDEPVRSTGLTWGARMLLNRVSGYDPGIIFKITWVEVTPRRPVAPFPALSWELHRVRDTSPIIIPGEKPPRHPPVPETQKTEPTIQQAQRADPAGMGVLGAKSEIYQVLSETHHLLNLSNSELVKTCWLCVRSTPPFYEAVAAPNSVTPSSPMCSTEEEEPLSLSLVETVYGRGFCVGQGKNPVLCSCSVPQNLTYRAPQRLWFFCTNGLFKCLDHKQRLTGAGPCLLTMLIPWVQIIRGNLQDCFLFSEVITQEGRGRARRATPVLVPILAGVTIAGSLATGIGALAHSERGLQRLYGITSNIERNVVRVQSVVKQLHSQINSLAEVVLQNRRGFNLLFLEQGGLCAALGEECCFYANNSGVIMETLDKLDHEAEERRRLYYEYEGPRWYDSLFDWSPKLTSLIAGVTGPIITLLVMLTAGPCLLNWINSRIQSTVKQAKIMILRENSAIYQVEPSPPAYDTLCIS
ncbi:PREDICTED: endogenous retrovirus group S71 member 1 Env polyprotein-like [Chinchilla lanigera]|uniref:endogenous retrovirus group S71 member 1 Env polyprotein-like n=1 Tax=Chinchilla lanigera TaxID=34839 RepID=UPI000696848B|nr:PREDICTED: endogenous retrovirus group S71 member 1 Env polyprotein-like [Chinchilla lanigera]